MSWAGQRMLVGAGTGRRIATAGSVCAALAVMALTACTSALGAQAHYFAGSSFGVPGSGAGDMSLFYAIKVVHEGGKTVGSGVAVNDTTHDVYVADTGNRRVDEFEADGTFVRAFGWGVENGEEKLEVCTSASGCQAGLAGAQPGELETPVFVAIDNDPASESHGDVYVGDANDGLVTKFTAAGELVSSWGNNGLGDTPDGQLNGSPAQSFVHIEGLAVSGSGELWLLGEEQRLFAFSSAGASTQTCTTHPGSVNPAGLAIDGAGAIYLGAGFRRIVKIEPDCAVVGRVTPEYATGIAANPVTNELYVNAEEGTFIEDIPIATCTPAEAGACPPSQDFGEGALQGGAGVGIDSASGIVYVANTGLNQVMVFAVAVAATGSPAGEVQAHEAVLHASVNPEGAELTKCDFEYGEGETYDHVVPCEEALGSIGGGISPVPVQAKAEGLTGGAEYQFRLHVGNAHGEIRSEPETLTTATVASVAEASSGALSEEADGGVTATLGAKVNPNGIAGTTCQIEYGTTTGYGATVPCAPSAISGNASVAVSVRVEGLSKATEYHWRVVVTDVNGSERSADQTFVYLTEPTVGQGCENERLREESDLNPSTGRALAITLPDCRAYELVTPPFKNGATVENALDHAHSIARDGARVIVMSDQCFAGSASCVIAKHAASQPFLLERGTERWVSESLAPSAIYTKDLPTLFNADTGSVLYQLVDGSGEIEKYSVRRPEGSQRLLGPGSEMPMRPGIANLVATPDLSHIVYDTEGGQVAWPSLVGAGVGGVLYEYSGFGQPHPELVGVSGSAGSTSLISACETTTNFAAPGAISADGRIVYFESAQCATGTGANAGQAVAANTLYARVDGSRTVLASGSAPEPQCDAGCQAEPPANAHFEGASEDGARVFFTDTRRLLDEASEDGHSGDAMRGCTQTAVTAPGCNLYELECPSHCVNPAEKRLVDVSAPTAAGETPRVQGVVAVSADGSHVYFVARGALTPDANREGHEPLEGGENLYVYERDGEHPAGRLGFVATLSASAGYLWEGGAPANVTPDGRYLVFTSKRGLTADVTRREGPAQVYRYDAQSEALLRVSVGERGFDDNGNVGAGDATIVSASESRSLDGRLDPTMSDDGRRVFFQSPVGLTAGALNDVSVKGNRNVLAENVYEWEAAGDGGCGEPAGCVFLISDGRDLTEGDPATNTPSAVSLMGTDASGANVFFKTANQLVGQDDDTQIDIYDARIDGGFPAPEQQSPMCDASETLVGEACSHAGSAVGAFSVPLSAEFSGPSNVLRTLKPGGSVLRGLTRAQRLARALAACRKRNLTRARHARRLACERRARSRYGPVKRGARAVHRTRRRAGGRG